MSPQELEMIKQRIIQMLTMGTRPIGPPGGDLSKISGAMNVPPMQGPVKPPAMIIGGRG